MFKSICAHALLDNDVLVVPDTREDIRFSRNPLVTGEAPLYFYAGALLKTPDGLPLGTVCVLDRKPRQITDEQVEALRALARQTMAHLELRRALAAAEESDRYRSRLMAIAGHDLKTPLRTAAYAIDKMRRHANVDSIPPLVTARDAISLVGRSMDELAALAASSKAAMPDLQSLQLEDVLHSVLGVWRQPAIDKCLALRHVPTSLRVRSHSTLLTTLIGNLVGNAIKYTERGRVLVGRRPGFAVVEIIDSGIGLNLEQPEQIFQAFRQADPVATAWALVCGSCIALPRHWDARWVCAHARKAAPVFSADSAGLKVWGLQIVSAICGFRAANKMTAQSSGGCGRCSESACTTRPLRF